MPSFLSKGTQHDTEDANLNRLITKNRWVVESTNGLIKKWKYFDQVVPNRDILFINEDFRIVCSLINKYRVPRANDKPNDEYIAKKMLDLSKKKNELQERVFDQKRKSQRRIITESNSIEFPRLDEDYIRSLTFGVYQMKQARSYTREHLNDDGKYEFECLKFDSNIIKVKLNSRHLSQTIYTIFVEFDYSNKLDPIKGWYCDCKVGARTVGCCAHIASVIWYFCLEKFDQKIDSNEINKFENLCKDAGRLSLN